LDEWRRHGYFFRQAAIITFAMGLYLHVTRVFLGDDLVLEHVFTPAYDRVLTVPMVYAAVTGALAYRGIPFRGAWHRRVYWLVWFYIAGSVPLHIYNAYLMDSTAYVRSAPLWWTYVLIALFPGIIWFYQRLPSPQG
jgi:hypothetical protein